jgi:hypothetical protein
MFRASSSAVFSRLSALVVATCLASASFAPLAHAQGKKKPAAAATSEAESQAGEAPKPPDKKTRAEARKAYTSGEKAYGAGDYAGAYEHFNRAIGLIPSPHAEYWAAASLDKLNRTNEAVTAYEHFLADTNASKVGEEKVSEAKSRLDALKAKLKGEVNVVTTPAGASVTVDGQPEEGVTPLTLKLTPGAHKLSLALAGHQTKDIEVNVATGDKTDQKVELAADKSAEPPPAVAAPPPEPVEQPAEPPPPAEKRSKVPAIVTLGIAGAGAVVGTVFGLKALSNKSDYNDHPTTTRADDVERKALIADMAFGVAITLGVTGIVLLTSSDSGSTGEATAAHRTKPRQAKLNVAPYFSPHGGGAAARWAF